MTRSFQRWARPGVLYALVLLFLLWTVAPVLWIATMSVQPEINYVSVPPRLSVADVSLRWYGEMLAQPDFVASLRTSAVVSFVTMVCCLVFGALAAYPLSRLKVPHKNAFLVFSVVSRMIPAIILIIPMFLLMRSLKLLDTYGGLIIVYTAFLLPYVIWMLKNFFDQIPYALEAAARMDGCSRLGALFRVIIPVSAPGVVATAIFAFIGAWNEFLFALTFTSSNATRTVPVAIALLSGGSQYETPWGLIMAASVIVTVPLVILVLIFQRKIVSGLTAGGVKG